MVPARSPYVPAGNPQKVVGVTRYYVIPTEHCCAQGVRLSFGLPAKSGEEKVSIWRSSRLNASTFSHHFSRVTRRYKRAAQVRLVLIYC